MKGKRRTAERSGTRKSVELATGGPLYVLADGLAAAAEAGNQVLAALGLTSLAALLQGAPPVALVRPGQVLALQASGPLPPRAALVGNPGPGIEVDGDRLLAGRLGYLQMDAGQLSVLGPLWISQDRMAAVLLLLDGSAVDSIEPAWIEALLDAAGVSYGRIAEPGVDDSDADPRAIAIARGDLPGDSTDGRLEYHVVIGSRAGTLLADGSIDLRERNGTVAVTAGQRICTLVDPITGTCGRDVLGVPVAVREPSLFALEEGANTTCEAIEGGKQISAAIDGVIIFEGTKLSVNPALTVRGDVDFEVGNIDVGDDVIIQGSVLSGFRVRAGGSVMVSGVVEVGAVIEAGRHIVVAQGIIGETTTVTAGADVETRYVQGARILAGGTVRIGSFLYNARVQADGDIVVSAAGGERAGTIVGGEALAGRRLEARRLGSPRAAATVVGLQPPMELAVRLGRLRQAVDYCQTQALRILRSLGMASPDAVSIQRALASAAPARRQQLVDLLRKLSELLKAKDEAETALVAAEGEVTQFLTGAVVIVRERAEADVELRLGTFVRRLEDAVTAARFVWTADGIRQKGI